MRYHDLVKQQRKERALLIERAMIETHWRMHTAAQTLGMGPTHLRRILSRAAKTDPNSALGRLHFRYRRRCKGPGMPRKRATNV